MQAPGDDLPGFGRPPSQPPSALAVISGFLPFAPEVGKPGGILLLSTPNLRSFRGVRNLLVHNQGHAAAAGVYEQYEKLRTIGHMGHVREYTTREVSDFVTRIGFRVDTIIFRGGHGKGVVGVAERLVPSLRPFFTLVASKALPSIGTDHPPAEPT